MFSLSGVLLLVLALCGATYSKAVSGVTSCSNEGLAKYNLTFQTFWSRQTFPNQYPLWRPNAQWTKMLGRSHSGQYSMWSLGELASDGVKQFAEKGETGELDKEVQGRGGILDVFNTENVATGVGQGSVRFMADSKHSQISLMSHIVPSPDWFVGVDSLDLCEDGEWIEEVSLDLGPHDAGTDKGYTFTSPNWPDVPQKAIVEITNIFPNHRASSFYYPDVDELPPMARVLIRKVGHVTAAAGQEEEVSGSGPVYDGSLPNSPFMADDNSQDKVKARKNKKTPAELMRTGVLNPLELMAPFSQEVNVNDLAASPENKVNSPKPNTITGKREEDSVEQQEKERLEEIRKAEEKKRKEQEKIQAEKRKEEERQTKREEERKQQEEKRRQDKEKEQNEKAQEEASRKEIERREQEERDTIQRVENIRREEEKEKERQKQKEKEQQREQDLREHEQKVKAMRELKLEREREREQKEGEEAQRQEQREKLRTQQEEKERRQKEEKERKQQEREIERQRRRESRRNRKQEKSRKSKTGASSTREGPVDCALSEWYEWSACSKTCGYGNRQRMRRMLTVPSSGGMPCPPMVEEELCGSMKSCGWNHFGGAKFGGLFSRVKKN